LPADWFEVQYYRGVYRIGLSFGVAQAFAFAHGQANGVSLVESPQTTCPSQISAVSGSGASTVLSPIFSG
jgi:hypothetical protein